MRMIKWLFLILFFLAAPKIAFLAETIGEGIKISPVRIEQNVYPGMSMQETIKVTNESDNQKELKLFVRDFKAEGEDGQARLLEPGSEEGYFMSAWVTSNQTSFIFEPREEKEITVTITVPENIGPGGYYGALVIGSLPPDINLQSEDKGAAITIAQQTACLLLFRVAGDVDENLIIKDFVTDKTVYGTPFEVNFTTRIENAGNVHTKPIGLIEVYNMFGEKKDSLRFNDKASNVMPMSTRKYANSWSGKLAFGKYKAMMVLSYGLAADEGGDGKKTIIEETYFWILPWKIIVPVTVGLVSLITLVLVAVRIYKNRAVRRVIEEMNAVNPAFAPAAGEGAVVPMTGLPLVQVPENRGQLGLLILFFTLLIVLLSVIIFFIFFA